MLHIPDSVKALFWVINLRTSFDEVLELSQLPGISRLESPRVVNNNAGMMFRFEGFVDVVVSLLHMRFDSLVVQLDGHKLEQSLCTYHRHTEDFVDESGFTNSRASTHEYTTCFDTILLYVFHWQC